MGRSASLASTPYFRAKTRMAARTKGLGPDTRQAAPTARLRVFFGNSRSSVQESSATLRFVTDLLPCVRGNGPLLWLTGKSDHEVRPAVRQEDGLLHGREGLSGVHRGGRLRLQDGLGGKVVHPPVDAPIHHQ